MDISKYRPMHCMKGGAGDGDVCHYGYDYCECSCQKCQEARALEDKDILRKEMNELDPRLLAFIKEQAMMGLK